MSDSDPASSVPHAGTCLCIGICFCRYTILSRSFFRTVLHRTSGQRRGTDATTLYQFRLSAPLQSRDRVGTPSSMSFPAVSLYFGFRRILEESIRSPVARAFSLLRFSYLALNLPLSHSLSISVPIFLSPCYKCAFVSTKYLARLLIFLISLGSQLLL